MSSKKLHFVRWAVGVGAVAAALIGDPVDLWPETGINPLEVRINAFMPGRCQCSELKLKSCF